jgi:peptidoglycan/xylan/chitin deacetylase (PgdA/CDA1 family)
VRTQVKADHAHGTSDRTIPAANAAPGGISRRRLLSAGAITLLGVTTVARARQAGNPPLTRPTTATRPLPAPTAPVPPVPSPQASLPESTTIVTGAFGTRPPIEIGASLSPQTRMAAPQYYVDDAGPTAIALTLDDGPDPLYTPQVLEILDQYGIQATFNMIGRQIGDNLPLVREVAAAGHTITNHTWDHADMRRYGTAQVISEIDRCNDALDDAGQTPTIFRAPYGYWTPAVFEACAVRGLTPLGWSVDPQDWDTAHVKTKDIVRTVLRTTHPHDIILEHDGGGDRRNTVAALRTFIPALLDRGFTFAAV